MSGPLPRDLTAVLAVLACLGLAGCGSGRADTSGAGEQVELTVFAAASLSQAFATLGADFEQEHPGTTLTFSFGPSSGLATQINQGAPVDVFASASTPTMDEVLAAGNAATGQGAPQVFARNTMQIAVPVDNPGGVDELADLADPQVKVALCQEQVPCGVAAATVLANAGLSVDPVTREADVKAVLTKVALGEVDAGLVYVTDVRAAGEQVRGVAVPQAVNATTDYPIAVTGQAAHPDLARDFIAHVRSREGEQVLSGQGFSLP